MLNKAIEIAIHAHAGQVDKAGEPYIFHSLRVMLSRDKMLERICAILHDVVEDSNITLEDLRKEGFSEEVITILDCLTKRDGESYDDFIDRILSNETACYVKISDLCGNMNMSRIKNPTEQDLIRMKRYREAAGRISGALPLQEGLKEERVIKIDGCVSIQSFLSQDEFLDRFMGFVETNGWFFGGGIEDITDKE